MSCPPGYGCGSSGRVGPSSVAVSPDGRQLAISAYDEQQGGHYVLLLEPNSQKLQLSIVVGPTSISR